jgi:aminoglycoside phosphotransferase (APT) family kinase protein
MIDAIRAHLLDRRNAFVPPRDLGSGALVVGRDKDPSAKVTYVLFDRLGKPAVAAKVARRRVSERSLVAEYSALRQLRSGRSPLVSGCTPEPLFLERIQGRLALILSALEGAPMVTRYYQPGHTSDPGRVAEDFQAAGTWLRRFHHETMTGVVHLDDHTLEQWVGSTFVRYRNEIGWTRPEADLFEAVAERATALAGCAIPMTAVHGDYSVGNLLLGNGGISGVVDWELGRASGLPLSDVYKFPTSYGFYLDRAYPIDARRIPGHPGREELRDRWRRFGDWPNLLGFGYSYFGQGWFPEQVRRFVLQHLEHLGLPPAVNAVFFPTFLAEQAMTLPDPAFRRGYRSLLRAFWEERSFTWLWHRWGQPRREAHSDAAAAPLGVAGR